jgi:hypothetical protein
MLYCTRRVWISVIQLSVSLAYWVFVMMSKKVPLDVE